MARRRKKARITRSRGGFKKLRSRPKRGGGIAPLMGAAAYGAVREKISLNYVLPLMAKINFPMGNIADEVGMLLASWAAKRYIGRRVPLIADAAKAGMIIEAARIGETIAKGQLGLGAGNNNAGGMVMIG